MRGFEIAQLLTLVFGFLGVVWHQQRITSKLRTETREDFREISVRCPQGADLHRQSR